MSRLHVVSTFAGVGGIDLAAEHAGMTTKLLCEINKPCRKVLAARFPDAVIHPDVTELTADDLRASGAVPGRTIFTAGWPCQGNSVAGRRGGMGDPRSGLWSQVARLLGEFKPRWFVGENVPGLLSVNGGRDFGVVLQDLAELGYGFAWRVLDARYFGVPQRRRRVILVGHLGGTGASSGRVLLEPAGMHRDSAPRRETRSSVASRARESVAVGVLGSHAHTLTAEGADASEDGTGRGMPVIAFDHLAGAKASMTHSTDVTQTILAGGGALRGAGAIAMPSVVYMPDVAHSLMSHGGNDKHDTTMMTYVAHTAPTLMVPAGGWRVDAETAAAGGLIAEAVHENQRGEINLTDTTALNAGGGKPGQGYPAITDGIIVRRLTPLECERLQGFPDRWTLVDGTSDSQRYRQMGNSVAVPVLTWVLQNVAAEDAASVAA